MTDELKPLERRMIRRSDYVKDMTIVDLVSWCTERGLSASQVKISGTHLKWETPETNEEQAQYLKHVMASDRRKEEWEREALVRFASKYGYVLVPKIERTDNHVSIDDPGQWPSVG